MSAQPENGTKVRHWHHLTPSKKGSGGGGGLQQRAVPLSTVNSGERGDFSFWKSTRTDMRNLSFNCSNLAMFALIVGIITRVSSLCGLGAASRAPPPAGPRGEKSCLPNGQLKWMFKGTVPNPSAFSVVTAIFNAAQDLLTYFPLAWLSSMFPFSRMTYLNTMQIFFSFPKWGPSGGVLALNYIQAEPLGQLLACPGHFACCAQGVSSIFWPEKPHPASCVKQWSFKEMGLSPNVISREVKMGSRGRA